VVSPSQNEHKLTIDGKCLLLQDFFPEWEDFFPDKDRRTMYVWAPNADDDDILDMVWLMQELKNMEREQHGVPERCESGPRLSCLVY
jgi:hypothetical protein